MLSHDQVQAHSCPLLTATVSPHRLDEQQQPAKTSGSVRREHTSPSTAHREQWSCLSPAGKQSQLRPGTVHSFVATQIPGKNTHNHPKLSKAATNIHIQKQSSSCSVSRGTARSRVPQPTGPVSLGLHMCFSSLPPLKTHRQLDKDCALQSKQWTQKYSRKIASLV